MNFGGARRKAGGKYNNKWVVVDGIKFQSQKEGNRYSQLMILYAKGEIDELELQPPFPFIENGKVMFHYKADFRYRDRVAGVVIEDVKGYKTDMYLLKKKLIEARYGIEITEI